MYSVAISLNDVKDDDDLLLQLVRICNVFNKDIDWLKKLSEQYKRPTPLSYKGMKRYGSIEVTKNG